MRIGHRKPLRRRAVFRQETGNPRQQVHRAVFEAVGQPQGIAQSCGDAGFRSDGGLREVSVPVAVRFRVDQEGGAPSVRRG